MNNYEKLFSTLETPQPPRGLAAAILSRIERRQRRILGAKLTASTIVFSGSLWIIATGYIDFTTKLTQSGFLSFSSLLFSDFSSITSNLPDFLFSIIESFPVFSAAIMLGGIGIAIWSMAALLDEAALLGNHTFSYSK